MILILPDASPRQLGMDFICPEMGWSNIVSLTHPADGWSPETQGTLSIKCVLGGSETYLVDGNRMTVTAGNYLILNHGQRYASNIAPRAGTESLCVFFRPGLVEEVLAGLTFSDATLLADPEVGPELTPGFFEKLYRHDPLVSPRLSELHGALGRGSAGRGWIEEQLRALLDGMLRNQEEVVAAMRRLPVVRAATRAEIYRRLSRARDLIESDPGRRLTLADMAAEACLSPHHFLRLFKSAFGLTPHQHLTLCRLRRAAELLDTTDRPIATICTDLGFESPTSFSLLFRRHHGLSPAAYRRRGS
jgi:AraC-like DNA-binding protein